MGGSEIVLGTPIEIDGKEVIIFRDVIGTDALRTSLENEIFTIVEPLASNGRPPIFIDEKELLRLRDSYPGIPVYGIWQLLFANDKVPLGNEVIIFPTGADRSLYIRLNPDLDLELPSSIISSSEYFDGFAPELMDYDLQQATRISVFASELKLPDSPAYTRAEIHDRLRHVQQRRWVLTACLCLAVILCTAVINYAMYANYTSQLAVYKNKEAELLALNVRLDELKTRRLISHPNNGTEISRLVEVLSYDQGMRTPEANELGIPKEITNSFSNSEHHLITSPGIQRGMLPQHSWLASSPTPEMKLFLSISKEQTGENEN